MTDDFWEVDSSALSVFLELIDRAFFANRIPDIHPVGVCLLTSIPLSAVPSRTGEFLDLASYFQPLNIQHQPVEWIPNGPTPRWVPKEDINRHISKVIMSPEGLVRIGQRLNITYIRRNKLLGGRIGIVIVWKGWKLC
jgi:hypothetical protein